MCCRVMERGDGVVAQKDDRNEINEKGNVLIMVYFALWIALSVDIYSVIDVILW